MFLPNSPEWPDYFDTLRSIKAPLPNISNNPLPSGEDSSIYEFCCAVQSSHLTEEDKKSNYRALLPALFILRNEAFICFVLNNLADQRLYLQGESDQAQALLRTNHGFSIELDPSFDYSVLKQSALALNTALAKVTHDPQVQQAIMQELKRFSRGPWQTGARMINRVIPLRSAAPASFRRKTTEELLSEIPCSKRWVSFEEYAERFHALPEELRPKRANIVAMTEFKRFIEAVFKIQKTPFSEQNKHPVYIVLNTLTYIQQNMPFLVSVIKANKPLCGYRVLADKDKGVLRDDNGVSFHIDSYDKDTADKFTTTFEEIIRQIESALKMTADNKEKIIAMASTFSYSTQGGSCLDKIITPILLKALEFSSQYENLNTLLEKWTKQRTPAEANDDSPEADLNALKSAWAFCRDFHGKLVMIDKADGNSQLESLTPRAVRTYLKILGYTFDNVAEDAVDAGTGAIAEDAGAVGDHEPPISPTPSCTLQ